MRSLLVAAASAAVLVGCSGSETMSEKSGQQAPPVTSPPTTEAAPGTVIKTADSQFGEILFDDTGQVVYLFDKEETTTPECYDECADAWSPVLTEGNPVVTRGADASAVATTTRADGSTQVTYAGHPLYYYAHEGKNEVLCHDVREFGGLWLVLTPTGEAAAH